MAEELGVCTVEETIEIAVRCVIQVGMGPTATKRDVTSMACGGATQFATGTYRVEVQKRVEEADARAGRDRKPWRGRKVLL
jgi:hypothetical protein